MRKELLPIAEPCTENWNNMAGDARRRACQKCAKDVINLSAMTGREVARLLARGRSADVCVRYNFADDGQVELQPEAVSLLIPAAFLTRGREAVLGVSLMAAALVGCNPAGPAGDALLARAAISQAAQKLGESGACSVSMEPVLPLEVRVLTPACAPPPVAAPLSPAPLAAPVPPPMSPSAEQVPTPTAPSPTVNHKPGHLPVPPVPKKDQPPPKYPHKLMGKMIMPRSTASID